MRLFFYLPLIVLGGCAAFPEESDMRQPNFNIQTTNEGNGTFKIRLTSTDTRRVCIAQADWPNSDGAVDAVAGLASLSIDGRVVEAKGLSFGYCPGGCKFVYLIEPGRSLEGYVSYAMFDEPAEILKSQDTRLSFSPNPRVCTRKDLRNVLRN